MGRVTGIGGIFMRANDPAGLAAWYHEHLGVPADESGNAVFGMGEEEPGMTVWALFPRDTDYFGTASPFMVNYRVDDLDAVLDRLRAAGAVVDDRQEEHEYGRFGWATDSEGNRFELWEPAP